MTQVLEAGRALDALVAEKVLGAEWNPNRAFAGHEWLILGQVTFAERGHGYDRQWDAMPAYSTDIAAAFEVVAEMRRRGWSLILGLNGAAHMQNGAKFVKAAHLLGFSIFDGTRYEGHNAVAETPALAICRAALAAVAP